MLVANTSNNLMILLIDSYCADVTPLFIFLFVGILIIHSGKRFDYSKSFFHFVKNASNLKS